MQLLLNHDTITLKSLARALITDCTDCVQRATHEISQQVIYDFYSVDVHFLTQLGHEITNLFQQGVSLPPNLQLNLNHVDSDTIKKR